MYAVRYSDDIARDFERGYSFAGWGVSPYLTEKECSAEWPHHDCAHSTELGGWLPVLPGLCAAGTGDTSEEAQEAANCRSLEGLDDCVPGWVFPCRLVDVDEYGWDVVVPTGEAMKIKEENK